VLVNPLAAPAEVAYQLEDAGVGAVFTTAALAPKVPDDIPRVLLDDAPRTARVDIGGTSRSVDLGTHHGLDLAGEEDAPGRDEEATVVYTSAMAGYSLGSVATHRNLLANARATVEAGALDASTHALAVLPFSHLFGLTVSGAAVLLAGGRVTTMERFHPIRALEIVETQGITFLVGVPAVFAALAAALARRDARLAPGALATCICGGAPLATGLQDRWFDLTGTEMRQGYGLTEAGPVCLFNRVGLPNRRGTLGVPFPGVRVSIQEPASGAHLGAEMVGEICVAGENVSPGYVRNGTQGLARRGEWLQTGDLGVMHDDGTVSFRGLIKPMFTRSGFNVYPRELERVVRDMPGVRGARVTPIPEPTRENDVLLEVVGDATEGDVRAWCESRLSSYKQPTTIVIAPTG
jgi:long-chain acyl-CoA synthetase